MKPRILLAGLICGLVALAAENGPELFQKAVTLEKANGNLGEAIKLYQRVAKEFSSDRALAAKALIQAAHCYELLGQGEQAVKFYEQVTLDFGDQRQPAEMARSKLASLRFEVASVRKVALNERGGYTRGGPGTTSPSEINYVNLRLETLIEIAYDLKEYQLLGPDWLRSADSEPFVINATIRPGATKEQVNQMLRNLLAERFKLTVHRETRDLPVYELVLVKRGPKLKESLKQGAGKENGNNGEPLPPAKLAGVAASFGLLEEKDGFLRLPPRALPTAMWSTPPVQHAVGGNQTIAGLVTYLSHASQQYYGRPVVDKAGLTGNWDYNLEFAQGGSPSNSPGSPSDPAPDLITAVRDQLGLKMEPKKSPIEVLVIDHIEKTLAQTRPSFEVATIKPAQPMDPAKIMAAMQSGGRLAMGARIDALRAEYLNVDLKTLLIYAYGVKPYQIAGPDWMSTPRFDVVALMPEGSTKEDAPKMLQSLLEERFKLTIHRAKAEHPVLALVVGKDGPKLKASAEKPVAIDESAPLKAGEIETDGPDGPVLMKIDLATGSMVTDMGLKGKMSSRANPDTQSMHIDFSMTTMAGFAEMLTRTVTQLGGGTPGRQVVDMTGIQGNYDVSLEQVVDMTGIQGNYDVSLEISMAELMTMLRSAGVDIPGAPGGAGGLGNAPAVASDPGGGSSVTDALQSMGLKLESRKAMVDQIIVDHVEKTPTAN
jgi:uncharacterized protein (TIGR03435 family)